MLDGDLDLGPVIGTYYSLLQKEISNIPTVTPSLFNKTRRITRHNVSVTRYKSVIKKAMTGRQPVHFFSGLYMGYCLKYIHIRITSVSAYVNVSYF